jgi:D-alanyl-D-alanine carboxypeptidase (penicillin-binding protein 5/6)
MTQTSSSRTSRPVYSAPTLYGSRKQGLWLLGGAMVAVVLVLTLVGIATVHWLNDDSRRDYLSSNGWPTIGQGAYRLGDDDPAASPNEQPVPIASLAKVMTAYVVLSAHPLKSGSDGFTFTVTAGDVADTERRRARDESLVDVEEGETLSERQALMAMMLPSANNVAVMIAKHLSGSASAFVAKMNETAHRLGMDATTYTDPSGFDATTVSTATDQLILAEKAAELPVLAQMMATPSYQLPVAGTVHNTDTLLGSHGFVGMKTGSDDAAGGCFMFRVLKRVGGKTVELIGVVLGQSGHNLITAGLTAARQLAARVLPS